ncbi:MAG: hypothetical protein VCD34_00990, partial [Planctomycetota bacterium]
MNPLQIGLRGLLVVSFFTLIACAGSVDAQGLLITEFQAFNETTLADEDNEYPDWIEIFNSGESAVNLDGYYLTDSIEELNKW